MIDSTSCKWIICRKMINDILINKTRKLYIGSKEINWLLKYKILCCATITYALHSMQNPSVLYREHHVIIMFTRKEDAKLDHELLNAISGMMQSMTDTVRNDLKSDLLQSVRDMVQDELKPDLLLTMSDMMDHKLQPVNDRLKRIELTQENDILPRLQNIESCYLSTFKRYQVNAGQIDALQDDVDILKKVVAEHSEKLQKLA